MRSALTALGVIIGVGAVIAMTEIGQGSKAAIEKTIASMGAYKLPIFPGAANNGGVSQGAGTVQTLKPGDVDEIARQCPAVAVVVPMVWAQAQVVYGKRNWVPQQLTGTAPRLPGHPRLGRPGRRRLFHRRRRPHEQRRLPDRRHGEARTVRRRIAHRQDDPHPQRPLPGHRALEPPRREHDGPGPGRLHHRPLDDDQVPRQQRRRRIGQRRGGRRRGDDQYLEQSLSSRPRRSIPRPRRASRPTRRSRCGRRASTSFRPRPPAPSRCPWPSSRSPRCSASGTIWPRTKTTTSRSST